MISNFTSAITSLDTNGDSTLFWSLTVPATVLLVLVGAYHVWNRSASSTKNNNEYPPMSQVSMWDTMIAMFTGGARDYYIDQFQACGRIFRMNMPIPGKPMVVVIADTDDARRILADSKLNDKPFDMYKAMSRFTSGHNLLNLPTKDSNWYHRRKAMNPAFAPKRIRAMNDVALEVAQEWEAEVLGPLTKGDDSEVVLDIGRQMLDITVTVLCRAAFDYPCTPEERRQLLLDISIAWPEFTAKEPLNPLRKFCTWILPERQKAFRSANGLRQFALRVLQHYRTNPSPTPGTVVEAIDQNPNYKNDEERASDIAMMIFAGHDTTGFTVAMAFFGLAKHPEAQGKLREEIKSNNSLAGGNKETSYLKAVISETMRLYPAVQTPGTRTVGEDFVTQHGKYLIPKGSLVFCAQIAIARDPAIYEKPFDFIPSRWLDSNNPTVEMKRALFPFSLGSRNCAGQPLANAELYTFLSHLVERYQFEVVDEGVITTPATLRVDNCRLKVTKVE